MTPEALAENSTDTASIARTVEVWRSLHCSDQMSSPGSVVTSVAGKNSPARPPNECFDRKPLAIDTVFHEQKNKYDGGLMKIELCLRIRSKRTTLGIS